MAKFCEGETRRDAVKVRLVALRFSIKREFNFGPLEFIFLLLLAMFILFQVKNLFSKSMRKTGKGSKIYKISCVHHKV